MPRKSKEKNELDEEKITEKKAKKTKAPKKDLEKKETKKKTDSTKSKINKKTTTPNSTKKTSKTNKKTEVEDEAISKQSKSVLQEKKSKPTKSSSKSKKTTKSTSTSKSRKSKKPIEIIEYYDLPYRYNKTVIKLLAQTPTSLFVYWDISDEDRNNFISQYGEKFFEETKPVLLIHNETMNYTFEAEINDFANSWYLKVNDADCIYKIELGRKYYSSKPSKINNDYIFITSSNDLQTPNDHILFNKLSSVYFKNIKTNAKFEKKISNIKLLKNIGKIYNIYDLYKIIYSEENYSILDLNNPSSGLSSSSFKL